MGSRPGYLLTRERELLSWDLLLPAALAATGGF